MKARIKASVPAGKGIVKVCEWDVVGDNVYDCVDCAKTLDAHYLMGPVEDATTISDVINIHNADGVEAERVVQMRDKILSGEDITEESGLANVKAARTQSGELLLFDGHHTVLAYMQAGRKDLCEIPHLIVEDADTVYVSAEQISVFYGKHAKQSRGHWREYVINWMNPVDKQLCERVQEDMGELHAHIIESLASR